MDEEISKKLLEEEIKKLQNYREHLGIHEIITEGEKIFVTIHRAKDSKQYILLLECDGYGTNAPGVSFVNPADKTDNNVEFWPDDGDRAIKRNPNDKFICLPGIREYYSHHPGTFTHNDIELIKIVSRIITCINRP